MIMLMQVGKAVPWLIIGTIGVLAVTIVIVVHLGEKRRRRQMLEYFQQRGWVMTIKPTNSVVYDVFRQIAAISPLRTGAAGVKVLAIGGVGGRKMWYVEHLYTTGSGKSRQTHSNSVAVMEAPAEWSAFSLVGESFLHRLGESLGMKKDLKLDNAQFNKRWRVQCVDSDTALAVLSPAAQEFLAGAPSGEWWIVGNGVVACGRSSRMSSTAKVEELLARPAELVRLAGPEVESMLPERTRDSIAAWMNSMGGGDALKG